MINRASCLLLGRLSLAAAMATYTVAGSSTELERTPSRPLEGGRQILTCSAILNSYNQVPHRPGAVPRGDPRLGDPCTCPRRAFGRLAPLLAVLPWRVVRETRRSKETRGRGGHAQARKPHDQPGTVPAADEPRSLR
jgi:hypothetical protein